MPAAGRCKLLDLTVDFSVRQVHRANGERIALSRLSFDVFAALIEAAPHTLRTERLVERAWGKTFVSEDTIAQRIRLLRRALDDSSRNPRYIETQRSIGYRLIPQVIWLKTATAQNSSRRIAAVAASLAVIAVIAITASTSLRHIDAERQSTNVSLSASVEPARADDLYWGARELVAQRNPDSLRHAIRLYEQAVQQDPGNGSFLAALSMALSTSVAWYGDRLDIAVRAERIAKRAAEGGAFFDSEFALAFSLDAQGRIDEAQAAYERAVALNPDHYGARASLAYLLQVRGKLVEAMSHNMRALAHAPRGVLDSQIASCLRLLRFDDVAASWLARADMLDPDSAHASPARALDLLARGQTEAGRQVIHDAIERGIEQVELYEYLVVLALRRNDFKTAETVLASVPASISHRYAIFSWRTIVAAMQGRELESANDQADKILRAAGPNVWPEDYLHAALLLAAVGDSNKAMDALRLLEEAGYRDYMWLELLQPLRPLHNTREFDDLLARMRTDVDNQRMQLLTAEWLPVDWRAAEAIYRPSSD